MNIFLYRRVYTFEDSWSTLSATLPTDNRISVLCCRASVIKKEVTSLEPGENNTIATISNSFTTYIKHKTVLQLCSIIIYWSCITKMVKLILKSEYIYIYSPLHKPNTLLVWSWWLPCNWLNALTHVRDGLCRVDLANSLHLRWSHRGLCVGVRLWNNIMQPYKEILPDLSIMYLLMIS